MVPLVVVDKMGNCPFHIRDACSSDVVRSLCYQHLFRNSWKSVKRSLLSSISITMNEHYECMRRIKQNVTMFISAVLSSATFLLTSAAGIITNIAQSDSGQSTDQTQCLFGVFNIRHLLGGFGRIQMCCNQKFKKINITSKKSAKMTMFRMAKRRTRRLAAWLAISSFALPTDEKKIF